MQDNNSIQLMLEVSNLHKAFSLPQSWWQRLRSEAQRKIIAVKNVSFKLYSHSTLALVGESGCGKSTTGRCILRLVEPDEGKVFFNGVNILESSKNTIRKVRRELQIIFQDPYSSLNPHFTVEQTLGEVLEFHKICTGKKDKKNRMISLLHQVGMDEAMLERYPHEFSGGQRQRIGIARALAVQPKLLICDEPVSALDVSVQAQIINLLVDLQQAEGLTYLFIAHDLSVVHHISNEVAVMYLGTIVESARTDELFAHSHHPYTQALLEAIPKLKPTDKRRHSVVRGEVSQELAIQEGCPYRNRCAFRMPDCDDPPPWKEVAPKHWSRCWL